MSGSGDELQAAIERAEKAEAERDALALALEMVETLADDHGWGTGNPAELAAVRSLVHQALGHDAPAREGSTLDSLFEETGELAEVNRQAQEKVVEAIRDQYATRTTVSPGSVSRVSEPGHAIDLVLKDRDEWKRRALEAEEREARARADLLPGILMGTQADAFEIAAKLVESRRPEMPSGKPVTHLIAGLIDELAKSIRALKP